MNQRLNKKRWLTLIILGLLTINLYSITTSGDDVEIIDLSIYVPTSEPRTQYGKPEWICGIWHYANITLDGETDKISIVFYNGDSPLDSDVRDETNYYEWEYDHGSWKDVQHDSKYIEEDNCHYDAQFYSFYIGIDQYAEMGNWTLILLADDEQLSSEQVYVDTAVISCSLKTVPVVIQAEPFTEDDYKSDEKFTVENDGNVPLKLSVDYGSYENIFSTLNFYEILKPNDTAKFDILLHSRSTWKPGILTIESAKMNADVLYTIPPKRTVSLIESNISIGLPITLYIGHIGYELESLTGHITFQYTKNLDIYYNEIRDIFVYISGNGDVTVDISSENLDILKIFSGGVEVETPFNIKSTNTSEYPFAVRVRGLRENTTGYLYYHIEIDGEIQKYTTQINVGTPRAAEEIIFITTFIMSIFVIICVVTIIGYMIFSQMKHRKK